MGTIGPFIVVSNEDGPEAEYSLASADGAASALGAPILVVDEGNWIERLGSTPVACVFFLATHGGYAEDGAIHGHLERRGLRHTHSPSAAAGLMCDKHRTKLKYIELGIPTPHWVWRDERFGRSTSVSNWVVKPLGGGGKEGLSLASAPISNPVVLSEELIRGGYEVSVWVLGSSNAVALPPLLRRRRVEQLGSLIDLAENPPKALAAKCIHMATRFHASIEAHGLTKTDFVIDEAGHPWAVETDAHPALGRDRGAARQARKAGLTYDELIVEIGRDYV